MEIKNKFNHSSIDDHDKEHDQLLRVYQLMYSQFQNCFPELLLNDNNMMIKYDMIFSLLKENK